ncbi:MAG: TIR domain-containing protein [Synechococcales bacterium]|nr:TIR domain-containing protein [Synechococcales bacterium]
MHDFQDVFISYGRADSKIFAIWLHQRLTEQGLKVWFDQHDIPLAVDYQNQINDGIEKTDHFLFIISPHSVNSPYCLKEIEMAIRCNKRIVPLLHVEQIDFETWQNRHPTAEIADWESYQTQGLHSSLVNIHPAIAKINWLYFREGMEDPETALTNLLTVLAQHQDYVKKHTYFLTQALTWERHQKRSQYLLTGEERHLAEVWLQVRFQTEQPPCIPTDLHCEYITESIKNANNLMTQVFLCHAVEDGEMLAQVRRSLMRAGFTVWTSQTDIQTGVDFQAAIDQGIEEADNLVYLVSPDALQSDYCQHELDYARSLHKRIIPLLIKATDPTQISSTLQGLQYIDITDNVGNADYGHDESQLIKTLHQDALYYQQHKILLAKAFKWQRQNHNPSLLLRGHNLRQAEAWFTLANSHPHHLPTALHQEFIEVSRQQPVERSLDVFIAYSRVDSDFARRLNDALQSQGKTTWFDQESIASGSDFQQEIWQGIAASNNFLFIISPNSIASPYCVEEVTYARQQGKRVITVLCRSVQSSDLPSQLAGVQWIDFNRYHQDFFMNFAELVRTLDTDREHTRSHTRLLLRALEWDNDDRDPSFLLRGKELNEAEQWLKLGTTKHPQPTALQQQYIATSRYAPLRRPRRATPLLASLGASILVMVVRLMGGLQPLEIALYDQFMRGKPSEARDSRLLLVEIDDEDIKQQNKAHPMGVRGGTLPDPTLVQLLDRLQQAKARVIGIDMYRDFKTDQPRLTQHFQHNASVVVLCKLSVENRDGVQLPPELPPTQTASRAGFSDLIFDAGEVVRRQLVVDTPTPPDCPIDRSFSLTIARQYLEAQGKPYGAPFNQDGDLIQPLQLGDTRFARLDFFAGGYQQRELGGYQILLNFRFYQGDPSAFLDRVKLRDLLANRVSLEQIRDRIVLVGFTARAGVNDYSFTSVSELPGVIIQAQMVSQLTSAVLDGRPLIWWWPVWGDALWIGAWALVGGGMVWAIQRPRTLMIAGAGGIGIMVMVCYGIFIGAGGWLPLVPSAIALVTTGGVTVAITHWLKPT